ncbi:MAG TPA: hypothetical protein VK694_07110 [Verrucomicrobiae bacterium]|nr:hypothetical protein [Verrucomicrobiae bacterium]
MGVLLFLAIFALMWFCVAKAVNELGVWDIPGLSKEATTIEASKSVTLKYAAGAVACFIVVLIMLA